GVHFSRRAPSATAGEKMARTLRKARSGTIGYDRSTKSNKTLTSARELTDRNGSWALSTAQADKRRPGYSTSDTGRTAPNWRPERCSCMVTGCCCGCSHYAGRAGNSRTYARSSSPRMVAKLKQQGQELR